MAIRKEGGAAAGDVSGPGSSTDEAIARWDGTNGMTLQDSAVKIADTTGAMTFTSCSGADILWTDGAGDIGKELATRPANLYVTTDIKAGANDFSWEQGNFRLRLNRAANGGTIELNDSDNPAVTDRRLGSIGGIWNAGANRVAEIGFYTGDDTGDKDDGYIRFDTMQGGVSSERMRVEQNGDFSIVGLTASRALATDGSKVLTSATTTATELDFVSGVTSALQTQLDAKLDDFTSSTDNALVRTSGTAGEVVQDSVIVAADSTGSLTWSPGTASVVQSITAEGTADAVKAPSMTFQESNKSAGTGDGGDLVLNAGTSVGGSAGKVKIGSNAAVSSTTGTSTDNRIAIYNGTTGNIIEQSGNWTSEGTSGERLKGNSTNSNIQTARWLIEDVSNKFRLSHSASGRRWELTSSTIQTNSTVQPETASDNAIDLGVAGTARWRTGYFGTSIVDSGTLDVTGESTLRAAVQRKLTTVTTGTTVLDDTNYYIICDSSTGVITLTLPAASAAFDTDSGREYVIKDDGDASTNNITIDRAGSDTIDGDTSVVISADYGMVRLVSDGTNWFVVGA